MHTRQGFIAGLALALLAAPALGATAAEKCQGGKLKIAGKYDFCRLNAQAKAAKTGGAPDYTKCDDGFAAKWASAESKGAGMCPSNGDEAAIQAFITQHTDDLATALAGGPLPDCPGDVATCGGSLSTCTGDLGTCGASLTSTAASLAVCTADLATCDGDRDACSASLPTCVADLASCTGSLATVTAGTATAADVLSGQTFASAAGIGVTGTMPDNGAVAITPGTSAQAIAAGYHNGAGSVAGDAGLVAGNIRDGVTVFGVTGTVPSGLPATGQTSSFSTTGDSDGDQQRGLARSFTDNGDGTVTDHATGLMWEKKSDDGSIHDRDNAYTWGQVTGFYFMTGGVVATLLANLNSGGGFAGHTDWRIPNITELRSLVNFENANPATDAAFAAACAPGCTVTTCSCTQSGSYWSSTTHEGTTFGGGGGHNRAYLVAFGDGSLSADLKNSALFARAVRDAN